MKKKRNGPTTNVVRLIHMTEATQNAMYKFVTKITTRTTCSSTGHFRPRNSNILTEREKSEMGRPYIGELLRRLLKKNHNMIKRNFTGLPLLKVWRCGLVVDTWLRDQKVPGSSPGYARPTLSPWERLFTCIFLTPLMCKTSTRLWAVC